MHIRPSLISSLGGGKLLLGRHVREAVANGAPIVALESTVITHGLPEPQNLELARRLEREVRAAGDQHGQPVTPATVAIVKGRLVVGLDDEQLEYLACSRLSRPIKASRRDIAMAQALGLSAGTTVSATMAIACSLRANQCQARRTGDEQRQSPIKVFATGGTGGVHLGGQHSLDISADLYELARSPMGVVCSGFKSFLDTQRTLEFLETMGCTVMSLHETADRRPLAPKSNYQPDVGPPASVEQSRPQAQQAHPKQQQFLFPAFFWRQNRQGIETPCAVRSVQEAARILHHCLEASPLVERRASLLAVPIPHQFALDPADQTEADELAGLMDAAVASVEGRAGVLGKDKTPLILAELNRLSGGRTLRANIELLANNARVGAQLALEYARLANSLPAGGE